MASPPPPPPYSDPNQHAYPQGYAQPDPYGQQQAPPAAGGYSQDPPYGQQAYGQPAPTPQASGPPPPAGSAPGPHGGRGKRRGYAEEQYDFGAGANAGLTPAQNPLYAGQSMGGYPNTQEQQQSQFVSPMGGAPPVMGAQGGYGVPQGMSGAGAGNIAAGGYEPVGAPGMGGVTQSFGQMGLTPAGGIQKVQSLNTLFPIDLMQQPFNVAELEIPPPEIILPPNASLTPSPTANCPPQYMRSTINAIPTTHGLLKKSKLPFALIIQPYTSLHDKDDPVPLVSDTVISRCRRCRSYINPYVTFLDNGHRWRCNMCNLTNDVPQAFDWDQAAQKNLDRWRRPELNHSVVEFIAPQEYMVRPPQPLVYLFLLDVSYSAVQCGLLATAARTILESLDRIPDADRLKSILNPFLPIPGDLLVPLTECKEGIENLLGKLQDMFQNSQNGSSCMGSALQAGHKLISAIGGKIIVLTATLPSLGAGKLENREDKKLLGTSKESSLLQTANSFYKSFAVECSKNQVSVDMFLFSNSYQDVASLSNLPRYTGGQTYFYPGWNATRSEDAIKFAREFSDHLSAEIALEAVMRVRATTGLRMQTFYGNFFNRSSDLCAFPAFPRDQGYVVEVAIDEPLGKQFVCMQTAVLHTTCNGERRIRIMTLALPTTQNLSDAYASADQVAITMYFSHKAVEKTLSSGLEQAREALQAKLTELLITFKKELTVSHLGAATPLSFAANLKGLVVLFLGLMKHVGLRKSAQIPTDLRSAALCLLSTLPAPMLMQYIHPKFYSLHDMPDSCGLPGPAGGEIILPPAMNLSSERLAPFGCYLIDDTQIQFLWIGPQAVPQLVQDVFGLPGVEHVKVGKTTLPHLEGTGAEFNKRVRAVVEKSRNHKSKMVGSITVPHLYVVRGDGEPSLRLWAQTMLIEDRTDQGVSLGQFLAQLKEKVNNS
ncbi:unnamed protein product [Tuber melanosporum]|uniref:(Perigord truffle) hypothetical protein n=1 Tax=Tuber melanosporum (strain Mel28) TaxID=656061 RepID=D5GH40_TUBMM|nr:uncharacterized protein GSTUM_00007691001 [Tuber melanosporum]CAZ83833.1 unnamed protein product [Tuber melanosporum]